MELKDEILNVTGTFMLIHAWALYVCIAQSSHVKLDFSLHDSWHAAPLAGNKDAYHGIVITEDLERRALIHSTADRLGVLRPRVNGSGPVARSRKWFSNIRKKSGTWTRSLILRVHDHSSI